MLACAHRMTSNHPKAKIIVTGHSLGAAAATFAALEINEKVKPISAFYTFGQPRVGNDFFKAYFEKVFSHLFLARITHEQDPFIHMPPQSAGFVHLGTEIFYDKEWKTHKVC